MRPFLHDHDAGAVGSRILNDAQADAVKQVLVVLDVWELVANAAAGGQEKTVGHLPAKLEEDVVSVTRISSAVFIDGTERHT